MQRIIKFRAWDTECLKMIIGIDEIRNFYEGISCIDECLNPKKTCADKQIKIMQFTGLKDINGKEIWEGDIMYVAGIGNMVVQFKDGRFNLYNPRDNDYEIEFLEDYEQDIEIVIGNIYEKPELLK